MNMLCRRLDYRWRLVCIGWVVLASPLPCLRGDELNQAEEAAVLAAVSSIANSVVQIQTVGGLETVEGRLASTAATSGVIVSADGHIICSSFNFLQKPSAVLVTLPSGTERAAEIVARDKSRRLVLLKIETDKPLPVPPTVPRHQLRVGQWAIAVGKSFAAVEPNVSVGIVSATSRIWGRAIQTDAKVSPANYGGPLVDIRGQVMGILVPLSIEEGSELTGSEMYDSGIGFAVPLAEINQRLERMMAGEDLTPGLLGLTLTTKDMYQGQPTVASCAPKSPAREAGIVAGDEIIEINKVPVHTQAQLKHALGPLYAGDTVDLVLLRDSQRNELQVTLAAKIEPYVHPFMGLLPGRDDTELVVRYVYPASPAAKAELAAGDRLLTLDDQPLPELAQWRTLLADKEPGETVTVEYERDDKRATTTLELATLPEDIPAAPAPGKPGNANAQLGSLSLPEEANQCWTLLPEGYDARTPHGLLVWLAPPEFESEEEFQQRWQQLCNQFQLVIMAPQPQLPKRWLPAEATVIRKLITAAVNKYSIDDRRVVLHGYQAGGAIAHRVGLSQRELVRGLAIADAALPRGAELRSNDPVEPLAYYMFAAKDSRQAKRMQRDAEGLRKIKFPVTQRVVAGKSRYLNDEELVELCHWIDALDRI